MKKEQFSPNSRAPAWIPHLPHTSLAAEKVASTDPLLDDCGKPYATTVPMHLGQQDLCGCGIIGGDGDGDGDGNAEAWIGDSMTVVSYLTVFCWKLSCIFLQTHIVVFSA